ncbi:MAG: hypothetical protein ACLQJR_35040 [Stellaceae bacterium]
MGKDAMSRVAARPAAAAALGRTLLTVPWLLAGCAGDSGAERLPKAAEIVAPVSMIIMHYECLDTAFARCEITCAEARSAGTTTEAAIFRHTYAASAQVAFVQIAGAPAPSIFAFAQYRMRASGIRKAYFAGGSDAACHIAGLTLTRVEKVPAADETVPVPPQAAAEATMSR